MTRDWKDLPWDLGSYQGVSFDGDTILGRVLVKEIQNIRKTNKKFKDIDYASYLDEYFGKVNVSGLTFFTSYALKELDPIAYSEGMSEWSIDISYQELLENDNEK